jgi:hypothetical protein
MTRLKARGDPDRLAVSWQEGALGRKTRSRSVSANCRVLSEGMFFSAGTAVPSTGLDESELGGSAPD